MRTQKNRPAPAPLQAPKGTPDNWAEKIEKAVEAREAAKDLRKGRPAGFQTRQSYRTS